jgi:hypothetical protein
MQTSQQSTYAALLKSHDELRAAIILAGKELRRHCVNEPLLRILRRMLREARAARKRGGTLPPRIRLNQIARPVPKLKQQAGKIIRQEDVLAEDGDGGAWIYLTRRPSSNSTAM